MSLSGPTARSHGIDGRDPLEITREIREDWGQGKIICYTRSISVSWGVSPVHSSTPLVKKGSLSSVERNPICSKKCLDKGNRSTERRIRLPVFDKNWEAKSQKTLIFQGFLALLVGAVLQLIRAIIKWSRADRTACCGQRMHQRLSAPPDLFPASAEPSGCSRCSTGGSARCRRRWQAAPQGRCEGARHSAGCS